ncbi:MAG: efflux RND transporter permease subunit, partial [Candidatus Riflebacteria bacterium]|nr:efflux RND transporter permease subunit [Candidatus Riflebacteria bacterium]
KPFGVTMVVVTIASIFISFSLTPILSNAYLKKDNEVKNPLLKAFSKSWNWLYGKFELLCLKSFELVRKIPGTVAFLLSAACIAAFILLVPHLHVDFLPANDQSKLSVSLEFPANISLEGTQREVEKIINVIKAHKEVDAV